MYNECSQDEDAWHEKKLALLLMDRNLLPEESVSKILHRAWEG